MNIHWTGRLTDVIPLITAGLVEILRTYYVDYETAMFSVILATQILHLLIISRYCIVIGEIISAAVNSSLYKYQLYGLCVHLAVF